MDLNMSATIADSKERKQALDPNHSYIVQAPAGSGKTGLITQRVLVLLAGVDEPESILAITFTRKAAGEMRQRILEAIESATSDIEPDNEHDRFTWTLARKALERDREKGWNILLNPGRLHIQTIDSLCASLARQMPILSQFGSVPTITEDAEALYIEAARATIAELESGESWSSAISYLIQHMDNRLDKLQVMISTMLRQRDQWLRHVADPNNPVLVRSYLESGLQRLIHASLEKLAFSVPSALTTDIVELAAFAASNINSSDSPIFNCQSLGSIPGTGLEDIGAWEGIAQLLLKNDGQWRSRLTKAEGFPAPSSVKDKLEKEFLTTMKNRMTQLIDHLKIEDSFRKNLEEIVTLPDSGYTDDEWRILKALFEILRIAAAHLEIVFSEHGQVDYTALSLAAIRALGHSENPSELAMALDNKISHILVDEFQDTSLNQFQLLKGLTAGWQTDDGHTIFTVGDPMQSIYLFRDSRVSLFLSAKDTGIGDVPMTFLKLSVNFRSQGGIIDWVNKAFPFVLPESDNATTGAVSYSSSTAFHKPLSNPAVQVFPYIFRDDKKEAEQVVEVIENTQRSSPDGSIAILVRNRSHLFEIVKQLRSKNISFQAVDIDRLSHRPVIQDLLALTRALIHLGDRTAWLAVLRAPFCGLSIHDLFIIAGEEHHKTIFELINDEIISSQLSEDGRKRIERILPILNASVREHGRCPIQCLVEGVWIALGGPACVENQTNLEDAEVFLQLLEKLEDNDQSLEPKELDRQVDKLFALPDATADSHLQLMTIHKSKGLEFDTIIIPGLGKTPRVDEEKLLTWSELQYKDGSSDLLLAPISAEGEDKNTISSFLGKINKEKLRHEDGRLLYVAITRAKQHLYLMGHSSVTGGEDGLEFKEPSQGSLLSGLWDVVKHDFKLLLDQQPPAQLPESINTDTQDIIPSRAIISSEWKAPLPTPAVNFITHDGVETVDVDLIEFNWAGETARLIGIVIHRLYQHIGNKGIKNISSNEYDHLSIVGQNMLKQLGLPMAEFQDACKWINIALHSSKSDNRCKWILNHTHEDAHCEYGLSVHTTSGVDRKILDRTFVDKGIRWIIDYKSGTHNGHTSDEFMNNEKFRYQKQLEDYAKIFSEIDDRQIRLGLYFPLLQGWREWAFKD
jgi:ATP-dependent helicase/nuclease subunit A